MAAWAVAAVVVPAAITSCVWPLTDSDRPPPAFEAVEVDTQRWPSGVPLGGIGAGKLELFTDGSIGGLTINNNPARPILQARGCFAGIRVSAGGRQTCRMLRLRRKNEYKGVANVPRTLFKGAWPRGEIDFLDPNIPADIHLEAFTPIIPGDLKDSSLPAVVFRFTITNRHASEIEAGIVMSWENMLGKGGYDEAWDSIEGNDQREQRIAGLRGITFAHGRSHAGLRSNSGGEYYLGVRDAGGRSTVCRTWNAAASSVSPWSDFVRTGELSSAPADAPAGRDGRYQPAGAVASNVRIAPGAQREVVFVFAWWTPYFFTDDATDHGHYYANHFSNAGAVASYVDEKLDKLHEGTTAWQKAITQSNLPVWFRRRLIDSASVLSNATVLTKDKRFAFVVDPSGAGRLAGPSTGNFARSLTMMLYPELERSRLELIASTQRENGAIPRDCGAIGEGIGREFAGDPTTDDTSVFILQALHYYRWTGDSEFLERVQPRLLAALDRLGERNGDGIPGDGPVTAARATTFLAALTAGKDISLRLNDRGKAGEYHVAREQAAKRVSRLLWNGRFFDKSFDASAGRREALCGTDMLMGEWMGRQIGLGPAISDAMVDSSLISLLKLNSAWSPKLPPEDVTADLSWQSQTASLPETEALLASMLIRRGFTRDAFELLKEVHEAVYSTSRRPWSAPSEYVAATGEAGAAGGPLSGGAAWWALAEITGVNVDAASGTLFISPSVPPGEDELTAPVFLPGFRGELTAAADGDASLEVVEGLGQGSSRIARVVPNDSRMIGSQLRYSAIQEIRPPVEMAAGATLDVRFPRRPVKPFVQGDPAAVRITKVPAPPPMVLIDVDKETGVSLGAPVVIENLTSEPALQFDLVTTAAGARSFKVRVEGLDDGRYVCYVRGRRRKTASQGQWSDGLVVRLPAHHATSEHRSVARSFRSVAEAAFEALEKVRDMDASTEKLLVAKVAIDGLCRASEKLGKGVDTSYRSKVVLQPVGAPPMIQTSQPVPETAELEELLAVANEQLTRARAAVREQFYGTAEGDLLLAALLPVRWQAAVNAEGRLTVVASDGGAGAPGSCLTPDFTATVSVELPVSWDIDRTSKVMELVTDGSRGEVIFELMAPPNPLPNARAAVTLRFEGGGYEYKMRRRVKLMDASK